MKKLKLAALLFFSFLTAISMRADLVMQEPFNYADGELTNVSSGLWIVTSGSGHDMLVKSKKLEVAATGGVPVSRQDDDYRWLSVTNGSSYTNTVQALYASFTVICTNLPNGAGTYFAGFYNPKSGNGGGYFSRIFTLTNGTVLPNTWRLGLTANATSTVNKVYSLDLALNTPYQVVVRWDPLGIIGATIWINPINSNDPSATTTDSVGFGNTFPVNAFAFRQAGSSGNYLMQITNLDVATTFDEAATNIWLTNAVAPTIIYQPTAVISNFVGASFSLSAVANGQGLGSMTYQWQVSATLDNANPANVSSGDLSANNNILTFNGGQTTDSGYYTLVATTPYGLSVTSSIAKVSISAAPVPPTFITQPVSQTIYTGQNMILSTSVSSPGNVAFTWYSNNVVVTAGQADSGDSSTLELDNVSPANSATYKVAVTNNVVANGIVSSNAVVAVSNAPIVTIAFLRTLVDPNNNYLATNSTLPYQVTGTITTATNLTSGNSASYYLQDATAGINIFATFGSTFRPAQGDVVTFVGVMSSFSSGLELDADPALPYTSYTDTGTTNPLPAPLVIPFTITNSGYANMNTNIAGRYVQLQNVFFGTNAGTTISSGFMTVTNAFGQSFNLWFSSQDLDTTGQTVPVFASSVTGVMFGSMNPNSGGIASPNFAVGVTRFADIVVTPPTLGFLQTGNILAFSWTASGYNLQSETNSLNVGLTTNSAIWFDYPDPSNPVNITIDPANPTVFYRLHKP